MFVLPKLGEIFNQRYKLLSQLGTGGGGTVFKAEQIDAGRLLALKILRPELLKDADAGARFLREAQALSQLNHINIV
ncbi:MAG: hypothetical protein K2X27_00185, partial [Candidatus Obscuribacterales bacterium]|nr:hypothetical protein [Candidatus Obscuribacterales bacterium]